MNIYQVMEAKLSKVLLMYDKDANISIWLGSLAAYNAGYLIGKWISLPCDDDQLEKAMNILTNDGAWDYFIADYEGKIKVYEFADPYKLNELAEKLEALDEYQLAAMKTLMDYNSALETEEAIERVEDYEGIEIFHGSLEEWGYERLEQDENIPNHIIPYININYYVQENTWDYHIEKHYIDGDEITILVDLHY